MADFMNEQEQVELIKNLWNRYGNWVLGLFVIIAFSLSGYQYWEHRQAQNLNQASEMYLSLVNSANQKDWVNLSAQAQYLMANNAHSAYAGLGALVLASADVNQNKLPEASAALQWILNNQTNQDIKDVARVRLARINLSQGEPLDAIKILTPVSQTYFISSEMVLGDAYVLLGQNDQATQAYQAALGRLQQLNKMGGDEAESRADQADQADQDPGLLNLIQMKLASLPSKS